MCTGACGVCLRHLDHVLDRSFVALDGALIGTRLLSFQPFEEVLKCVRMRVRVMCDV